MLKSFMQTQQVIQKAENKIQAAERALKRINHQNDLNEKSDAWLMLLYNLAQVSGAIMKLDKKYQSIIGQMLHDQKTDPLITYVFQARNSETHRLESAYESSEAFYTVSGDEKGLHLENAKIGGVTFRNVTILGSGPAIDITSNGPLPISGRLWGVGGGGVRVKYTPSEIRLLDAYSRGVKYPVPTSHRNNPIDPSIVNVATLSIEYYKQLINRVREIE